MRIRHVVLALAATAQAAFAQQAPNAGAQLRQIPPPPAPVRSEPVLSVEPPQAQSAVDVGGARILVSTLRVTGQTAFDESTLLEASGFRPGTETDLSGLRAAAARIAAFYRARGYFLAQAYLPAQDVQGGVVTISVIEGRYGTVSVANDSRLHTGVAEGIVRGLGTGDAVRSAPLERRLLILSDLPGVVARGTLAPGAATGTSDLTIDLVDGRRVTGSVEADNAGNRYTGTYRVGGTVNLNEPFGIGDVLSVRVLASTSGLAYGRASWQAPIGDLTVGASFAYFRYDLGREFRRLDASGDASVASLYASYPLVRSRRANLYATGALEAKWFDDRIGIVSSRSRKASEVATIGLNGSVRDGFAGGGWTSFSVGLSYGDFRLRNPLERAADRLTVGTDGAFAKVPFALARSQALSGPATLFASVRGQVAFDNLDPSEKMELGGAYGVRAYPEGEAYGDTGFIGTVEARLAIDEIVRTLPGHVQTFAFVDAGQVDYAHNPWFVGRNTSTRSGFGAGVAWTTPGDLMFKATYARRIGDALVTSGPDRDGRFWLQASKSF